MSLRDRIATILLALGAILAVAVGDFVVAQDGPEGGSRWYVAEPAIGESSTVIYLHLTSAADGLDASLSLPSMRAWEIPVGRAEEQHDAITIGSWSLTRDPETGALVGELPENLVPHRSAAVSFRPAAPPDMSPPTWSYPEPRVLWRSALGEAVWAGLARDDTNGHLLIATAAGKVHALDSATGATVWITDLGEPVRARPTVAAEGVYVVTDAGRVLLLDHDDGGVSTQILIAGAGRPRLDPRRDAESRWDHYGSAVAILDERLFVGTREGRLVALDRGDGELLWSFDGEEVISGTPAVAPRPDGSGSLVVFGDFAGIVRALDADTGVEIWQHRAGDSAPSDVAIADGRVLTGNRAYDFEALDLATGEVQWSNYFWFSWVDSVATVADGTAYIGSSDALALFAFDLQSGRRLWSRPVGGWSWSEPAIVDDRLFAGTVGAVGYMGPRDGSFVGVDRGTGAIRWRFDAPRPHDAAWWGFAASPIADGDRVFAADLHGRVYAFATDH